MMDEARGRATIHRELAETSDLSLEALFSRAVKDRLFSPNPFAGLEWDHGRKNSRPDFTPEERRRILFLSLKADPAIKWGNWLAAFGGQQNEELADLDARDISASRGSGSSTFREENRTADQQLKTPNRTRLVPLHSAILREGFLKFVQSVGDRPLYHHLKLGPRSGAFTSIINEGLHETVSIHKIFYSHRHVVTSILRNTLGLDGRPSVEGISGVICLATVRGMCAAAMARFGSRPRKRQSKPFPTRFSGCDDALAPTSPRSNRHFALLRRVTAV